MVYRAVTSLVGKILFAVVGPVLICLGWAFLSQFPHWFRPLRFGQDDWVPVGIHRSDNLVTGCYTVERGRRGAVIALALRAPFAQVTFARSPGSLLLH